MSKIISRKILISLVVAILGSLAISGIAIAKSILSPEELQIYSANNIVFYEPCTGGSSTPGGSCISEVSGSTIEEKIWSGLTAFLTEEQAAGVMGNMSHEGGFNPARHETTFINSSPNFPIATNTSTSYGIGLIQWSFGRRVNLYKHLKENGAENLWTKYIDQGRSTYGRLGGKDFLSKADEGEANSLIAQELCFLKSELDNNKSYGGIYDTKTVDEASDYFLEKVEIPADIPGQRPVRRADAKKYYDQFHGKTISGGGGMSSGSDPACNGNAKDSMNINAAAVALAWPLGTEESVWKYKGSSYESGGSEWTGGKATDAFNTAIDTVFGKDRGWSHCPHIGASCDVGSATAIRWSGVDPKFPRGLDEQPNHVKAHPEIWELLDSSASPQPGDAVWYTHSKGGHIYIVVQDEKGDFYRAESGLCSSFFHISGKFTGFESNAKVFRAKNAKNSSAGVNVEKGVSTSSTTGKLTASGNGNGDINASALELAWAEGEGNPSSSASPKFKEVFNSLKGGPGSGCWSHGKSCCVFVNTVLLYSGARNDGSSKVDDVAGILDFMVKHPEDWEDLNGDGKSLKYSDLQGGDVLVYYRTTPNDESSTPHKFKGTGHLQHIALYVEDDKGGAIAEASYCTSFGKISRRVKPDKDVGNLVRVFRWKKQGGGSGCNVCAGVEEEGDGVLATGGFKSVSEADKVVMEPYRNASNAELAGLGITVGCNGWLADNCPSFSRYFFNKYTNKRWTGATGNGKDVADVIAKAMNLPTGKTPKAYAIFGGPSDIGTPEGHTGVILGVDTARKKVIIGEAGYCSGKGFMTAKEKDLSKYTSGKYTFVYLDSVLKSGGLASNE